MPGPHPTHFITRFGATGFRIPRGNLQHSCIRTCGCSSENTRGHLIVHGHNKKKKNHYFGFTKVNMMFTPISLFHLNFCEAFCILENFNNLINDFCSVPSVSDAFLLIVYPFLFIYILFFVYFSLFSIYLFYLILIKNFMPEFFKSIIKKFKFCLCV